MGKNPIFEKSIARKEKMGKMPIMEANSADLTERLKREVKRAMRPLVRLLIARGVGHAGLSEALKALYVDVAERDFRLPGKRMTDSRVSLLTALQRKDVRRLREAGPDDASSPGLMSRVVGRWLGAAPFRGPDGPLPLPRTGQGATIEALVREVSHDVHPRTVIDALLDQGLAEETGDGALALRATAHVPSEDQAALLGYMGANLGDHASAAVANVLAAPGSPPFFERAVYYNRLSPTSLAKLDAMARRIQGEALALLNAEAAMLQDADRTDPDATGRFRCGAYAFTETPEEGDPR